MNVRNFKLIVLLAALIAGGVVILAPRVSASHDNSLDDQWSEVLVAHGFTGRVGLSVEQRLGRRSDRKLADLGRLAFRNSLLDPRANERELLRVGTRFTIFSNNGRMKAPPAELRWPDLILFYLEVQKDEQ